MVHRLSRQEARRISVRAQLLDAARPTVLLELHGDRLVGKLDAVADRRAGVLRINAMHEDVHFTTAMRTAIDREIRDLARWLHLHIEDER